MAKFAAPFLIAGTKVKIGIGIAFAPKDGATTDEILVKADTALYRSKAGGRSRFSFFQPE